KRSPTPLTKRSSPKSWLTSWLSGRTLSYPHPQIQAECWTMYFDRSVMKTGAGAGLLFISPLGEHMRYVIRLHFPTSNNMVEYEALLSGLRIAIELGIKRLDMRGDSQLVVDQVIKESSCHDPKIEAYCNAVRRLE